MRALWCFMRGGNVMQEMRAFPSRAAFVIHARVVLGPSRFADDQRHINARQNPLTSQLHRKVANLVKDVG